MQVLVLALLVSQMLSMLPILLLLLLKCSELFPESSVWLRDLPHALHRNICGLTRAYVDAVIESSACNVAKPYLVRHDDSG